MFKDKNSLYAPLLVLLLVVASFFVGRLSAQVSSLKGGNPTDTEKVAGAAGETESPISVANLKKMAKDFGVDESKFNKCLDDGVMAEKVKAESKEGSSLGVSGTPSFVINGLLVVGALPQTNFETIIDAELKNGSGIDAVAEVTGEKVTRQKTTSGTGYVKGGENAKIKIIEYTDFECPYCNVSFPTIEALLAKYGNDISLEYRSFPLSFHANAQKAAEAVLCAGEQGKFWEMHDKMFVVMAEK